MLTHNIPKWCFTYRLSVIHTLQEETVELRRFCCLYPKHVSNPDKEVLFDVSIQLPGKNAVFIIFVTLLLNKQLLFFTTTLSN